MNKSDCLPAFVMPTETMGAGRTDRLENDPLIIIGADSAIGTKLLDESDLSPRLGHMLRSILASV